MANFTITINEYVNQPPSQIGDNKITIDLEDYIFTIDDFTTDTEPVYTDPEGDEPLNLKVLTLPDFGKLVLDGVDVEVGDIISFGNIVDGLLIWEAPEVEEGGETSFTFDIADEGSETYSGLTGTIILGVNDKANKPPSEVGDGEANINYNEVLIFTRAMFTTNTTPPYSDPEGDEALLLRVNTLPISGKLQLNGVDIVVNQIISFEDIDNGLFTYVPDNDGNTESEFDFSIADAGSQQFTD